MGKMMQCFLVSLLVIGSSGLKVSETRAAVNPIRKVVVMLQKMQAEVTADGEREEANYKKFMCYCKNNVDTLRASIEASKNKIASLEAQLKEGLAEKQQQEAALAEHQNSRKEA